MRREGSPWQGLGTVFAKELSDQLTSVRMLVLEILIFIIAQIPGLEGIKPYLLTEQYEAWHGLLRTPTNWAPIGHSAWVCALYAVPALIAGYLVFLRRDVAGG